MRFGSTARRCTDWRILYARDVPRLRIVLAIALASSACQLAFPTREATNVEDDAGRADANIESGGADTDATAEDAAARGPSCVDLPRKCGSDGTTDCCASAIVPSATYKRSFDAVTANDPSYPATISDLRFDVFEVTVGRFRRWVAAYETPSSRPTVGAGKNPRNAADQGWQASFDAALPQNAGALVDAIKNCNGDTRSTWSETDDTRPINCVRWSEAFAFCIWDGGRLASEAEWNLAAAGGSEQRVYPWSTPPTSTAIDGTRAVFSTGAPVLVGSKPAGNGRWGHADLGGNVAEWVLDFKATYMNPCNDCAQLTQASERIARGGGFDQNETPLHVADRGSRDPLNRFANVGIRCARDR
jgi:formylglycine-generating enzyme